ncbi:peptide chain release factor 1, mitochondrial [Brachionichthys hirsutus]|uniref:peptide chain release factor 1, mitochondrial n=1 Tax=Brachionichthys hirsutus TaxID=412623 RepID=UPI003604CDCE
MFASRWFRVCTSSSRAIYSNGRRGIGEGRPGTLTGHTGAKHANATEARLRRTVVPKRFRHSDFGDLHNNVSVQKYIHQIVEDYGDIGKKLRYLHLSESERKALLRRRTELQPLVNMFERIEEALKDLEELSLLQNSAGGKDEDEQLTQLLKEEEEQISRRVDASRSDLMQALVPPDPLDSSDVLLEVVSGRTTGGDISQQFAAEMFEMYQGFASYMSWDFEVLNYTHADYGGLHHAAVRIAGENVYRLLRREGGTHRVQIIPEVGLSSRMQRIHTGTMTVIILPQPAELDVHIDPKDLRIDTFRSRGAGGQSVNTTDSAVRVVHLPTGLSAECQQTRSQLQNRDAAMRMLKFRLYQSMASKENDQRHRARKQQVGTRSQSERIRTYNFNQDRVTDHRTGYAARDIKEFMRGGEPFYRLICDVLKRSEMDALLRAAESSLKPPASGQSAD